MANGNGQSADKDMIAFRLSALMQPFCDQLAELCQCIKDYASNPASSPCESFPLFWKGSIIQTAVCHSASSALQIPKGMIATITRVTVTERYPGALYGANMMLMVNDNLVPNMPRIDHSVGSMQTSDGLKICLEEQDIISILLQCSWTPVVYSGVASTYLQTIFPWQIEGYMEYKQIPAAPAQQVENIS